MLSLGKEIQWHELPGTAGAGPYLGPGSSRGSQEGHAGVAARTCSTGPAGSSKGSGTASALGIWHVPVYGDSERLGLQRVPAGGPAWQPHDWARQGCGELETVHVVVLLGQGMMKLRLKYGPWVMRRVKSVLGESGQGHQSRNHKLFVVKRNHKLWLDL